MPGKSAGVFPQEATPLKGPPIGDNGAMPVCGCAIIRRRSRAVTLVTALIFSSALASAGMMMTLPTALPALKRRADLRDSVVAELPIIGGAFYALGKGVSIFTIYHLAAKKVLVWIYGVLAGAGLLLFTVAVPGAPASGFYLSWAGASFAVAHGYGACSRVVANWVDHEQVGRVVALFSGVAMDIGGASSAFIFGYLLDAGWWRAPFWLVGAFFFTLAAVNLLCLHDTPQEVGFRPPRPPAAAGAARDADADAAASKAEAGAKGSSVLGGTGGAASKDSGAAAGKVVAGAGGPATHPLDELTLEQAGRVLIRDPRCWLAGLAATGYSVVFACTTTYLPLYATETLGASDGAAARLLTCALAGALVGDVGGGLAKDLLSSLQSLRLTLGLNATGMAAMLSWLVLQLRGGVPYVFVSTIIVAISVGMAWSWNVWISAFQVRHGGLTHSATLAAGMDLVSFTLRVPLFLMVGLLATRSMWAATICALFAVLLAGHCAMGAFLLADHQMGGALPVVPSGMRSGR